MVTIVNCPVCKHEVFNKATTNCMFGVTSDVVRCINCSLVFLNKQLDDKELLKFYRESYRTNKRESYDENRYLGDLERAISQFEFFNYYLYVEDEILDIGAGWGINVNFLFSKGYKKVVANEWDDKIEQKLNRRIPRKTELIGDIRNQYDFIIMSHSLEHLFELEGKMAALFNTLQDGGRLFVEVPNAKNNKIVEGFSNSYHYWYFTMEHLLSLAANNGFEILKTGVYGKKHLIPNMNFKDFTNWKRSVLKDEVSDIIELSADHENAYWLRILLKKPGNKEN